MRKLKIDWLKAKQDYLSNTRLSLRDIALKYGISYGWLKKVSMKKGWNQKKQQLIEKGKIEIENNAEKSIEEQIKQHKRDANYIKDTVLSEIRNRVENGSLKNENLTSLVRLLDIGMRELRELLPRNLVVKENSPREEVSPELLEAAHDVLVFKLTRGSKNPSGQFDEARKKRWEENINAYINYKKDNGVNIENGLKNC